MTPATISSFKEDCEKLGIHTQESSLGKNLRFIEEVDFWLFVNQSKASIMTPIRHMEIGSSIVIHFFNQHNKTDYFVHIEPYKKEAFFQLLGDYTRNADFS